MCVRLVEREGEGWGQKRQCVGEKEGVVGAWRDRWERLAAISLRRMSGFVGRWRTGTDLRLESV